MNHAHAKASQPPPASSAPGFDISFDDLVDVVNPLQHIPIVSTLYRKYSGDQIKPLEKIAGDTLYGGMTGLASSLADFAFEKITGKNFGDMVLGCITGDDKEPLPAGVAARDGGSSTPARQKSDEATRIAASSHASNSPNAPMNSVTADSPSDPAISPAGPISGLDQSSLMALAASLDRQGVDDSVSARTLDAYRRAAGLQTQPQTNLLH